MECFEDWRTARIAAVGDVRDWVDVRGLYRGWYLESCERGDAATDVQLLAIGETLFACLNNYGPITKTGTDILSGAVSLFCGIVSSRSNVAAA